MAKTTNVPRIIRGVTKIEVPHEQEKIVFIHPPQGPHDYQTVGKGILARNLKIPSAEYTALLIHPAYCNKEFKDEPEFKEIRDVMRNRWFWVFNRNLWTPEGVYVVQDSEAIGISQPLNQKDLEKKLSSKAAESYVFYSSDGTIRFAPKESYKLGEHTAKSLARDSFIIASFGKEGAEKLAEVSSKFNYAPKIWGVKVSKGQEPIQRVSALGDCDGGLDVYGYFHGDWGGCAFGI